MKRIITLLFIGSMCTACSQSAKQQNPITIATDTMITTNAPLSSKNYVERMTREVKDYMHNTEYYFFVYNNLCMYEILVNDVPVARYYKSGRMGTPYWPNNAILQSGTQKITYRLYPLNDKKANRIEASLLDDTKFEIEIYKRNKKTKFDHEEFVMVHHNEKDAKGNFIATGQPYYEYTFTFEAEVPYKNTGWTNSQDLRKRDPKELLYKVEQAYQKVWHLINEKQTDDYFSYLYTTQKEIHQSDYDNKEIIEDVLMALSKPFTNPTFKMEPLANYKMVFYGDGRLVCLEHNSLERRERGKSALWGKYKTEKGTTMGLFRSMKLHIPNDGEGFEAIR